MAAPEEENYLSVYRQFLREFTTTVDPNDPLPVKVTGYALDDADLEGEIIDWSLQYLNQKSCPQALAASIARSVLGEMQSVIKEDHELRSHGDEEKGAQYDPLKLMHAVITRTRAVCERCLSEIEGGGLEPGAAPLPPPLQGPPFVSSYAIKNHRRRMEDRHVAIEDLNSLFGIKSPTKVGYYAIFDGHHGHEAAAYSAAQLHCLLVHSKHYPQDPEAALKDSFFRADEIFIRKCLSSPKLLSGTTALVALVRYRESLHVAWLGDSLGILVRSGGNVTQFVYPHTADRLDERNRIEAEGGVVIEHFYTWRINGTLAISRAIGDPDCKPHVSAVADVVSYKLDGSEHFIILACDGLWDCVSENEAAIYVYDHLRKEPENHADLSKLLVNFAKSCASNDNISVVVVLLSSVEDILASAPPPPPPAFETQEETEEDIAAEASPADGLALDSGSPRHLLVNGAMDMEAATADPSANPFAPCKGANVEVPSPEDHTADDGLMDFHHPNHHNGHSNNDIMTSSFYGNGGANGEDARHLFGDPRDLGPETDVDLLDDDGVDACYHTDDKDMNVGKSIMDHCVPEDGLSELRGQKEEIDLMGAGDFTSCQMDSKPLQDDHQQFHLNPFATGDWSRGKGDVEGVDQFGMTQFEEAPSVRQHFREDDGMMMGEQVVACKEETAVEKGEVVEEEELEIGGGSGVEEAYDDSEEEGEWKYVAAKPVDGGAAVPEAVTPEATLPDESSCSPALPEQDIIVPALSPALPSHLDAVTPEAVATEDFPALVPVVPPRSEVLIPEAVEREDFVEKVEIPDFGSTEEIADDNKFCKDLGFEVVQKAHAEEAVTPEKDLLEKSFEKELLEGGRQKLTIPVEVDNQEGEAAELSSDASGNSTMESRLNPDAAEFVPVSPTINVPGEPFTGIGNEFDAFKKEALECPGEVYEGVTAVSTPIAKDRKSLCFEKNSIQDGNKDEDLVLSSSFSRDIQKSPNLLESTISGLDSHVTGPSDYLADLDDDENKENIMQSEDKENVAQHTSTCDDHSVLNQSFEVLDEPLTGESLISDSVASVQTTAKSFVSEMPSEPVEPDVVVEKVEEPSDPFSKYTDDFSQQSSEIQKETLASFVNFTQGHIEEIQETVSGEINVHHFDEPVLMEGITQQTNVLDEVCQEGEIEKSFMEKDALLTESSPVPINPVKSETDEKMELLMQEDAILDKIEDPIEFHMEPSQQHEQMEFSHRPIVQICPQKPQDVFEMQVDPTIVPVLDVSQKDLMMEDQCVTYMETSQQAKSPCPEAPTDSHVEPCLERIQSYGVDFTTCTPEPNVMDEQIMGYGESQKVVLPSSETVLLASSNVLTSAAEMSDLIEESHAFSLEEKVPVVENLPKSEQFKYLEVDESEATSVTPEVELGLDLVSQKSENEICTPSTENITSPEPIETLVETKEPTHEIISATEEILSNEPLNEVIPQQIVEESIPVDTKKPDAVTETAIAAAAAAVTVAGAVATVAAVSASSDAKPTAKKATPVDKKKVPEKSKASTALPANTKAKPAPKASGTTGRTSTPGKAPITSPTKPLGATAARPLAERKTAAPSAKPATTTKSTTAAPLSSKPKTTTSKPTTASTGRVGVASKISATTSRPTSATSAAKSTTTSSKPLSSAPRPSTAPPKTTEVKKTLNGEVSKSSLTSSTTPPKTGARKPLATSSTFTSRTTGTSAKPAAARTSLTAKTGSESLVTKTKTSTVTSAVNGTAPKTSRVPPATGSKPSAAASAKTKAPVPTKTTTATAPGDPKKAKESANKHISATRPTGATAAAKKGADLKTAASSAAKSPNTRSPATAPRRSLANGTAGKKADANLNSKKVVEEKVELVISHHENGIGSECNEVRKELDEIVDVEEVEHAVKEQMVLIGDAIGVGEAV